MCQKISTVLALVTCAAAQTPLPPFDSPIVMFSDTSRVLSTADLDGDGDRDALGWWGVTSAEVVIEGFINDGRAVFGPGFSFRAAIDLAQRNVWSMAVGKFDADGRDDFLVRFGSLIQVYASQGAAAPTLLAAWNLPSAGGGAAVVADFDGDGLDDFALGLDSSVQIYLNRGFGFSPGAAYARAGELSAADFDGDGDPDLAIAQPDSVEIVLNDGLLRSGGLYQHGITRTTGKTMTVVGDIDGDGDPDVVAFGDWGEYAVLRHTTPAVLVVEPRAVGGPATGFADVDGDGDLDGVCCSGGGGGGGPSTQYNLVLSTFEVAQNTGGGAFAPAWKIGSLGAVRLAGAEDLDGDGDIDLIAGRVVFVNRRTFLRDPQPVIGLPGVALIQSGQEPLIAFDEQSDGDLDLQEGYSANNLNRVVYRNDGTGNYTRTWSPFPTLPAGHVFYGPGYGGDFDGDGERDVVVGLHTTSGQFVNLQLLRGLGGGIYQDAGAASASGIGLTFGGSYTYGPHAIVADLDGDGDLDLVPSWGTSYVGLNNGRGFFTQAGILVGGTPIAATDFDRDGLVDILVQRFNRLEVNWGLGGGSFVQYGYVLGSNEYATTRVVDVDGDGYTDICHGGFYFHNSGGGERVFFALPVPGIYLGYGPTFMDAVDVNGDGLRDIIAAPAATVGSTSLANGFYVALARDGGGFHPPWVQLGHFVVQSYVPTDVDGDGDVDLAGNVLIRNAQFGSGAMRQQYGRSGFGAWGTEPVLGASGPFRAGSTAVLRVRGARGGAPGAFVWGLQPANVVAPGFPNVMLYAAPPWAVVPFVANGAAGAPGAGGIDVASRINAALAGYDVFHQVLLFDDAVPGSVTYTNGMKIAYR